MDEGDQKVPKLEVPGCRSARDWMDPDTWGYIAIT
jgi:hypothetical protein